MIEANLHLTHYPGVAMSMFGKTSPEFGGQNLFRVIWAPSRKVTLVFRGQTRTIAYYGQGPNSKPQSFKVLDAKLGPEYKQGECWVLEIWKPCWDLTKLTETEWNANPAYIAQGPYPKSGDYELSEPFHHVPTLESIEKQVLQVRDGWMRKRPVDNAIAIRDRAEKRERDDQNTRFDIIKNRSLIGAGEAWSSPGGGGRGTKTIQMNLTTKDISWAGRPVPTASGVTAGMPMGRKRYKVEIK